MVTMSDAMHWTPDPAPEPASPAPLLRIDITDLAHDPAAARRYVEEQIITLTPTRVERLRALGTETGHP